MKADSMEMNQSPDKGDEKSGAENGNGDYLPKWMPIGLFKAIGPLALLVVLFGAGAGWYAYDRINERSVRFPFWVDVIFAFLTLLVIMIQVVIYAQQARFMEKQWSAMERQLIASERAHYVSERPYVVVSKVTVTNLPFEAGKVIVYESEVENKGKTPAYSVEFRIYIDVEPDLLPEEPVYRGLRTLDSRITLGMNTPATSKQTDFNDILTEEQIAAIKNGELFVYIWGIVKYREGFTDQTHHTKFYLIYDPEETRFVAGGHHNETT